MQVDVAWATSRPLGVVELRLGERRTTSALEHRALAAQPAGVDGDRAEELHGQVERGVELAGASVECTEQPAAVSSSVAITPPCTEPIGL